MAVLSLATGCPFLRLPDSEGAGRVGSAVSMVSDWEPERGPSCPWAVNPTNGFHSLSGWVRCAGGGSFPVTAIRSVWSGFWFSSVTAWEFRVSLVWMEGFVSSFLGESPVVPFVSVSSDRYVEPSGKWSWVDVCFGRVVPLWTSVYRGESVESGSRDFVVFPRLLAPCLVVPDCGSVIVVRVVCLSLACPFSRPCAGARVRGLWSRPPFASVLFSSGSLSLAEWESSCRVSMSSLRAVEVGIEVVRGAPGPFSACWVGPALWCVV